MDDLDKKIKQAYRSKKLSEKQLSGIINQQAVATKKSPLISKSLLKYAALFLVVLSTAFALYYFLSPQENKILNQYAEEIAYNHKKGLPVEIETGNVAELNLELTKLNFELYLPPRITNAYELKGGRYCSVDNRIAAQLKLINQQDKVFTCYVFKKEESFNFDKEFSKKGVQVSLWNSSGLVYALASDP